MRARIRAALTICMGLCVTGTAQATVGGPTLCHVLGWDAEAKRFYVHEMPTHAGDAFGRILFFDFAAADPSVLQDEGWVPAGVGEGSGRDPELRRRLDTLRSRLRPLDTEAVPALPWRTEIVARDTLWLYDLAYSRERVRAHFSYGLAVEAGTYGGSDVVQVGRWVIPGRSERVAVIAFRGDPFEGGYEVQVPVVVRDTETGVKSVRWGTFD